MILTTTQAEALAQALAHLSNMGTPSITLDLPGGAWVQVRGDGAMHIFPGVFGAAQERYPTAATFTAAYGLD